MFDTNVSDIFYGIENQSSYSPTATFAALKYQDTRVSGFTKELEKTNSLDQVHLIS